MSDLILNLRVGLYHLQISYRLRVRISRNGTHKGYPDGFISLYEFSPRKLMWNFH